MNVLETLFSFLFKYSPFYFREGTFAFQAPISGSLVLLLAALVILLVALIYSGKVSRHGRLNRVFLGLRLGVFFVLAFILLQPSIVLSTLVPQQTVLTLLVDTSASMGLPGDRDGSRKEDLVQLLDENSGFVQQLEENFHLRWLRFDSETGPLEDINDIEWNGTQTNLNAGLQRVLSETGRLPLGGVVLFTDGSDNSYRDHSRAVEELKARQVPIHVVGVGKEVFEKDVEILQVSAPRQLMPETSAVARVSLRQNGYPGARGRLEVREGSRLVESREIYFDRDQETTTVEIPLQPEKAGLKTYVFRLVPFEGEAIEANNSLERIVEVHDSLPRVLYLEGHPRWEYKFLRQAVVDDRYLRLETLLRTALNKFYRQGIEEETALAAGFPTTRNELFQYRGLILGNLESAFFTYTQMEMIRDFVARRGGGLLMLGGSNAYSDGGYQNTPIEEILPVWLAETGESEAYQQEAGRAVLTDFGEAHPALQLPPGENGQSPWQELPQLTDYNRVSQSKSGATVLVEFAASESRAQLPLLLFQRYGRGLGLSLLTGSSWRWQMLASSEDRTHETFWRQLLRWLVSAARDQVTVETERDLYSRNEPIRIRSEVNDEAFTRLNNASVEAEVISPSGNTRNLSLQWTVEEDGIYTGETFAEEDGLHQIIVTAQWRGSDGELKTDRNSSHFLIATGRREYFDAGRKTSFLQRLAEESNGRFYTMANVTSLPEEIVYAQTDASVMEVLPLWNMPFNFLLFIALLCGEWILRKRQGAL